MDTASALHRIHKEKRLSDAGQVDGSSCSEALKQKTRHMRRRRPPAHCLSFMMDARSFAQWQRIAADHKLTTDSEVAYFLMKQLEQSHVAGTCRKCDSTLTVYCRKCKRLAQQADLTPPPAPHSPGTPADEAAQQQIEPEAACNPHPGTDELPGNTGMTEDAHSERDKAEGSCTGGKVLRQRRSLRSAAAAAKYASPLADDIEEVLQKLANGQETIPNADGLLKTSGEQQLYSQLIARHILDTLSEPQTDLSDPDFEINRTRRPRPDRPKRLSKTATAKRGQAKVRIKKAKASQVTRSPARTKCSKTAVSKKPWYKERRHACEKCKAAFFGSNDLRRHMRTHTGERPYVCEKCGATFALASTLRRHNLCHTGGKAFSCSECGSQFHNAASLEKHMRLHTGEKPYLCEECGAAFIQPCNLQQHIKRNHVGEKPFVCSVCCAAFKTANHLAIHAKVHTGENPYQCTECGAGFPSHMEMKEHKRTHFDLRAFKCKLCDGVFKTSKLLTLHMHTHDCEEPVVTAEQLPTTVPGQDEQNSSFSTQKMYVCNTCGSAFKTATKLKEHIRSHTGEKPFVCKECGAAFSNMTNLKAHTRTHTGFKPYICQVCKASFTISSNLKTHMRIHTGERPYWCQHCSLAFTQAASLRRHMRTHTGDRPYVCNVCEACFMAPANLKRHMKTHSSAGDKTVACVKCGLALSLPANMYAGKKGRAMPVCPSCAAATAIIPAVEAAVESAVAMGNTLETSVSMGADVETAVAMRRAMETADAMETVVTIGSSVESSQMQDIKITLETLYNSQGP